MQSGNEYTSDEVLPGAGSLLPFLERRLFVWLRDGRTFVGHLRSIDQFANLVLFRASERLRGAKGSFAYLPQGALVVRGENVALLGDIKPDEEEEQPPTNLAHVLATDRPAHALKVARLRAEAYRKRGLIFTAEDYF